MFVLYMKGLNMRNLTETEFDKKYHMYKDLIYNIAYTYVHNKFDSDDITQDVFIKYLESTVEFNSLDNEKYWLIRVTINQSKNYLSTSWKKKTILNDEMVERTMEKESREKEKNDYYRIITSLPNKYKEPIVLFYYEDLKIEEIAKVLNISLNCAKKRLERGRQKIKEELNNE